LDAESKIRLGGIWASKEEMIIVILWFTKGELLTEHINWKTS